MIELQNFTKKYRKLTAVDDVSFICRDFCITGLLGPNGAGKSTILKAVCGVHYPTSGKVLVNGISVEDNTVQAQKLIGYVSEQADFPDFYKVSELLEETADLRLDCKRKRISQIEKVTTLMGLEEVFSSNISVLSKGYRQRLAFALALIHDPEVLILDEPVSGLDPVQIVEMRSLIKKLSAKKTILLSTHLMQEAKELCSDILILNKGRLIASGTSEEICRKTNTDDLEKAFVVLAKSQKDNK